MTSIEPSKVSYLFLSLVAVVVAESLAVGLFLFALLSCCLCTCVCVCIGTRLSVRSEKCEFGEVVGPGLCVLFV